MYQFDVVVVGAGPAGGQCARVLSKKGYKVLLVEQHEDFETNNYSSAASPLETLERFNLPETVVATPWHKIEIITTKVKRSWESKEDLGVVFDFAKLRAFLAQQVKLNGGEVYLGHRYIQAEEKDNQTLVSLRTKKGEIVQVITNILVDATGYSRSVLYPSKKEKPSCLKAVGIEYLIKVTPTEYQPYAKNLIFFLGHHWSPKGYGWIFPMDKYQLKVGAAWLDEPHAVIEKTQPLKYYIEQIIKEHIGIIEPYKLVDVHGSVVEYSSGLKDCYYRHNIIAIGDSVSTINALGGEGIRHAMYGAEIASKHIESYLTGKVKDFSRYPKEMLTIFTSRWNISEQLSRKVYLQYSDARIDQGVNSLKYLSTKEMLDILFHYRFEQYFKGVKTYLWQRISRFFTVNSKK